MKFMAELLIHMKNLENSSLCEKYDQINQHKIIKLLFDMKKILLNQLFMMIIKKIPVITENIAQFLKNHKHSTFIWKPCQNHMKNHIKNQEIIIFYVSKPLLFMKNHPTYTFLTESFVNLRQYNNHQHSIPTVRKTNRELCKNHIENWEKTLLFMKNH